MYPGNPFGPNGDSGYGQAVIDFMTEWEIPTGRLGDYLTGDSGSLWYKEVNAWLLADLLAAQDAVANPSRFESLTPSAQAWVEYINDPTQQVFWEAHNASVLQGVMVAGDKGYYLNETRNEREVIVSVLALVSMAEEMNAPSNTPIIKWMVEEFYPKSYPATEDESVDLYMVAKTFQDILEGRYTR